MFEESLVAVPAIPYRGIQPFRYLDSRIFFARDEEKAHLLRLVVVYRAALLYGDSGAGKSSLVNAGLIAAARTKGFRPERLRVQPRELEELVIERIASGEDDSSFLPSIFADPDDTAARTVLSTRAFRARLAGASGGSRPLLIFDQFEELVTLFESDEAQETQGRIVDLLVSLVRESNLP